MGLEVMAMTALALTAVGTGVAAYGQYQQGKASQALNNYNAQIEEQNATVAQRDAANAANATRRQNQRILASQRAAFAANGVVGESGSPLLTEMEQAGNLEMGALETERQGSVAAARARQQAVMDRLQGRYARTAANTATIGTLLNGGASFAGQATSYKYAGIT